MWKYSEPPSSDELYHHGILGQKWGVRRYQNPDGSLTPEGRKRYLNSNGTLTSEGRKKLAQDLVDVYEKSDKDEKALGTSGPKENISRYLKGDFLNAVKKEVSSLYKTGKQDRQKFNSMRDEYLLTEEGKKYHDHITSAYGKDLANEIKYGGTPASVLRRNFNNLVDNAIADKVTEYADKKYGVKLKATYETAITEEIMNSMTKYLFGANRTKGWGPKDLERLEIVEDAILAVLSDKEER